MSNSKIENPPTETQDAFSATKTLVSRPDFSPLSEQVRAEDPLPQTPPPRGPLVPSAAQEEEAAGASPASVQTPTGAFLSEGTLDARLPKERLLDGRYELLSLLGEGGMGNVYRARDKTLDEVVALKLLREDLTHDPEAMQRFKQEVKLARRVTHHNVARTFDLGQFKKSHYLTMECIEGRSLSEVLRAEGPFPVSRLIEVGGQICAGLQAAHQAHVIHRDLKPDNILLTEEGRVVLTDFGIARLEAGVRDVKTVAGAIVGTPAYMAPEQLEPDKAIDARTDIYALGAILFELLTGSRAWVGDNFLVLATVRFVQPPPDPRERREGISESAANLVRRCMALKAEERYQSATELSQALQTLGQLHSQQRTFLDLPASLNPVPFSLPTLNTTSHNVLMPTHDGQHSLAVLPFACPPGEEFLVDGIAEDLLDQLSMSKGLKVRSYGMVAGLRTTTHNPQELGQTLGVQLLVTGSMRKAGDQIQLRIRLVSTADGFQKWAHRFQCTTAEIFQISDEIAQNITEALTVEFEHTKTHVSCEDPVVVELYLRARHELRRHWHDDVSIALQLFEQARKIAPDDPLLLSGTAIAQARLAFYTPNADNIGVARMLAEEAHQKDPQRNETCFALAMVRFVEDRWGDAIALLEEILERSQTYADAHDLLGRILLEVGSAKEAAQHLKLALTLDPSILSARWDLARAYCFLERWDRANTVLQLPLTSPSLHAVKAIVQARLSIWFPEPKLDPYEERYMVSSLLIPMQIYEHIIATKSLSPERRQQFLLNLDQSSYRIRLLRSQMFCEMLAFLQEWDLCLDQLEAVATMGIKDLNWLQCCPLFKPLHSHPRYQAIAQQIEAHTQDLLQPTAP